MNGVPNVWRVLSCLVLVALVGACAPSADGDTSPGSLRPFDVEPIPRDLRWVIAVPDFEVRSGSVRITGRSVDGLVEGETFDSELGRGVSDIFSTEAFRSGRFVVTEREQLEAVLREQDFGATGRVDPATAAEAGRILGAEVLVLGSITEFGVSQSGAGGRIFGLVGGEAETVTARVSVDVRMVDAVTAELLAIGVGTAEATQANVRVDVWNVVQSLGGGRSGTTIIDVAVRNAIRAAIDEAAATMPPKATTSN